MTEHPLAVGARHVVAVDDRGADALQVLPEKGPALDEGKPAYSKGRLERCPSGPRSAWKSGKPFGPVRDRLAVQDDPRDRNFLFAPQRLSLPPKVSEGQGRRAG